MELINTTPFQFGNIVGRLNFPHYSVTLIVKGTFDLKPRVRVSPVKKQAFPTGNEFAPEDPEHIGSPVYESDFAYFKPAADMLLVGKCYAPNRQPVTQCDVVFQVGAKRSSLRVFGYRYWKHTVGSGSISEPGPFVEMPVNYQNAFGGEGFAKNPIGRGAVSGKLLPNIEDPLHLIKSAGDQPDPAGFGPLHSGWLPRAAKLGTYKSDYLQKRWPWFPEDFDWGYFNAAPELMRSAEYLRGNETLRFENLHREHAIYQSQLPGLRIRCFKRAVDPKTTRPVFEEVSMNLDTLWVNMEREQLVLVWRGWTEVLSEDFAEISHIFLMSEPVDQPPVSVEQAHELFKASKARMDREWSVVPEKSKALLEAADELVHEAVKGTSEHAIEKVVSAPSLDTQALQAQTNKLLTQFGIDVESLPAEAQRTIEEQQAKLFNRLIESNPAKLAELESQELRAQLKTELAKLDIDVDHLPAVSDKAKQEQRRFMRELGLEGEAIMGSEELEQLWEITSALLPKMELDPEDLTPLLEHAKKHQEKIQPPSSVEAAPGPAPAEKRAAIQTRVQNRESFAGEDLSGLDLSGMDLRGLDFSGALLIGANLQNSDLSDAAFIETKLIKANLTNTKLNKTRLSGADLTNADLSCAECVATDLSAAVLVNTRIIGADLSESDLSLADLTNSDLSGSNFENANLSTANASRAQLDNANLFGADLSDATFEGAQITNAKLDQVTARDAIFTTANLSGSRLVEAKLAGADFSGALLNDANFQGADLTEATLEKATARNINLLHAKLEKLRASEGGDFSGASFEQAQGKESIWHNARLDGANFVFSNMTGADFSQTSMKNIQCYGADMRFARFIKADLTSAQMLEMNLFKGSLEKANLTAAVLTGSNLYGVEFLDAHLDKTQMGGANLKATKLQEMV